MFRYSVILLSVAVISLLVSIPTAHTQPSADDFGYTAMDVSDDGFLWVDCGDLSEIFEGLDDTVPSEYDEKTSNFDSALYLMLCDGPVRTDDIFNVCIEMLTPEPSRSTESELSFSPSPTYFDHRTEFWFDEGTVFDLELLYDLFRDVEELSSQAMSNDNEDARLHVQMEAELLCGIVSTLTD